MVKDSGHQSKYSKSLSVKVPPNQNFCTIQYYALLLIRDAAIVVTYDMS